MVLVSDKLKLIFVHIPKTGGSSVNLWMRQLDPRVRALCTRPHEPISHIANNHGEEISGYTTFTVVRNPWERAVSLFHYRKLRKEIQPSHWPSRTDIDSLSFREVVLKSLDQNPKYNDVCPPRDAPQIAWLEPSCTAWISLKGRIAVDHTCKLETLQQDIIGIAKKAGVTAPHLPHINRTEHHHFAHYYDLETVEIVANMYERDLINFKYSFDFSCF